MEQVHGTVEASNFVSEDVISSMPENVITNIVNRLPIRDAVRTSILSRKWRFKWTLLTQLVFDEEFSKYLQRLDGEEYYDSRVISRLLLHLKGLVTKFILYIPYCIILDVKDINHWVMFLSNKGIKQFTLINMHETSLKLPTHLFSCLGLKHLKLHNCCFPPPPTFCGFPDLLSLDLYEVTLESGNYGEIITQCPLLEILKISCYDPIAKVKLFEIAKLENLKMLSLPLRNLNYIAITSSSIFQLGGYLPKLQELNLDFQLCNFLGEAGARKWVHTAFPSLKTLTCYPIDFGSLNMLSCAFEMIWGSPNLQTLHITATYKDATQLPAFCYSNVDNTTMELLQLRNVTFQSFRGSENELCLIKSLLACSPILNKIIIHLHSSKVFGGEKGKLMFATKLLELPRASTIAEVKLVL